MASSHVLPIDTVDLASPDAHDALAEALASTGFVQLVNHGLDGGVRTAFREASNRFFDLEPERKIRYTHPDAAANRGYRARGSEALSYSLGEPSPPDLFESFNSGAEVDVHERHALRQPTPWPDDAVPGFSAAAAAMIDEFAALSHRLDGLLAGLLDTPWLAAPTTTAPDMLASINYRPDPFGEEAVVSGQQRMGAHSDYTTFTLLDADPVRGLQIVGPSGDWVDVVPDEGGLLMNVGDVLAILTNDVWPSTLHRVIPMASGAAPFRRSVAYFHYPDLDTEIATLPAFVSNERPTRYEPVTIEQHLLDKLVAPKTHEPSTAASTAAGRRTD
jgi:isopenicillin N synthase-like dioxygenase